MLRVTTRGCGSSRAMLGLWLVVVIGSSLPTAAVLGQFDELPVNESLDTDRGGARRKVYGTVRSVMTGLSPLAENQAQFDGFFRLYFFPRMTRVSDLHDLPTARQEFAKLMAQARTAEVHDHLLSLSFPMMTFIVKGNFHPAARYNAMLMIGELNASEVPPAGGLPVPYAPAMQVMLQEYANPNQVDAVRLAAMIGFLRHAELHRAEPHLSNEHQVALVREMLSLIKQPAPAGRSPQGHVWLQRRAVDILSRLGIDTPDSEIMKTLDGILGDPKAAVSLRLTIAEAMSRFPIGRGNVKLDPVAAGQKLGALAIQVCRAEQKRIADVQRQEELEAKAATSGDAGMGPSNEAPAMEMMMMGGGTAGAMGGAMGGAGANVREIPQAELRKVHFTKQILQYQLYLISKGLGGSNKRSGGLVAMTSGGEQDKLAKLAEKVEALLAVVAPPAAGKAAAKSGTKPGEPAADTPKDLEETLEALSLKLRDLEPLVPAAALGMAPPGGAAQPAGPGQAPAAQPGPAQPPAAQPAIPGLPDAPAKAPAAAS